MITRTHTPSQTHSFFPSQNAEKTRLTPFSLNNFFFLHSFSLPPKYFLIIFSVKRTTKNGQKSSLKEKKKFSFFFNLIHIFPLRLRRKTKPLTFSAHLSPEIKEPQRKTSRTKFFFLLFFLIFLHPTALRNRKICHLPFFRNSDLKYPKMPLSALKFHILQITFFPP